MQLRILTIVLLISLINQDCAYTRNYDSVSNIFISLENRTVEVKVSRGNMTNEVSEISRPRDRDDYTYTPGIGWHKFHNQGKTWNEARKVCLEEGAQLAILNSKQEEQVLYDVFNDLYTTIIDSLDKDHAWLGVHNLFDDDQWLTLLGDPLNSIGFEAWTKNNTCIGVRPHNIYTDHCAALLRLCGMMGNYNCSEFNFAFFCEKPDV